MKKGAVIFILLLCGCTLFAQKFTATVSKNRVVPGEQFQLDLNILASTAKNYTPPSFADFNIHSGPVQSSQSFSVNGTAIQSITLSYMLSSKKEGSYTIGAASITIGNHVFKSNVIKIEVVKPGTVQQKQNSGGANENLYARTFVSKSKVFSGEQITVTHKVYTRLNLKDFQDVKFPSYNGFWTQEVTRTSQYEVTTENVDGVPFNVVVVKKAFLFPQKSGKIEIEPMIIQCVVREKTGRRNDPFEQFFGNDPFFGMSTSKDVLYSVKSNAVTIEVLPLPASGKPEGFPGAVGKFSMNASIDKERVKANEGVNLKIVVSGKGNLKLIEAPKMEFPDEFESYDPKTNDNISINEGGVSGSKTFEYLLIPRREGIYIIRPNDFSYFDTDKNTYVLLPVKDFTVTVEKGEAGSSALPSISEIGKEDVKMIGSDIRFIKTENIVLTPRGDYFFSSPLFVAGFTVPPFLFLAFLLLRREHIKRNSDLVLVRKRKASRMAKKQLSQAERSMNRNDKESFFENVLAALYNYTGNKMNIPVAELSKENVVALLKERNIEEATINELIKLLDECEFARYAPGLQSGDLNLVYTRAENIITKIEDVL